jgi:hypothetical protein
MPKMILHVATLGAAGAGGAPDAGLKYFFMQDPTTYTGLEAVTGVDKATEAQLDAPRYKVGELLARGIVVRITVSIKDGTKIKTRKLLVTKDKVVAALEGLKGKAVGGGTVTSARVPRRISFY